MGGYGSVYKAVLPAKSSCCCEETSLLLDGEKSNQKAFMSEICALTEIRHCNILKLYGFCSHPKALFWFMSFLEGGGLVNLLNSEEGVKVFDWIKRVNIIKGVANVLSYICRDRGTFGLWGAMAPPNFFFFFKLLVYI